MLWMCSRTAERTQQIQWNTSGYLLCAMTIILIYIYVCGFSAAWQVRSLDLALALWVMALASWVMSSTPSLVVMPRWTPLHTQLLCPHATCNYTDFSLHNVENIYRIYTSTQLSMVENSRCPIFAVSMKGDSAQTCPRWKNQCCGESLASPGAVLLTVESSRSVRADAEAVVSSVYLSTERRRAFMKKLTTVDTLRPSCSAIVAWISLLGRLISRKMATRVRRWISVNTIRGFLAGMVDPGSVLDDAPQDTSWLLFPPANTTKHCTLRFLSYFLTPTTVQPAFSTGNNWSDSFTSRYLPGTWSILVFDQFIWRPKTAASSCIIVIARTSTSSISAT